MSPWEAGSARSVYTLSAATSSLVVDVSSGVPRVLHWGARLDDDGAYYLDLAWLPPRTDGVVTEYQVRLDGAPATSLVFGGTPPRGRTTYSFYLGREAGERHRVRIRARLPDGTWGGLSVQRTVTTGAAASP